MIKGVEILDENEMGTLLIEKESLVIIFNKSFLNKDKKEVKIEPSRLKEMIEEGQTSESKLWLDCYTSSITFKTPDDSEIRMGIKQDFPISKPDLPKKDYISIETVRGFSRLLFEIEEVENALNLFQTNSLREEAKV